MPEKVKRICELYNVTEAAAEKMIVDIDKRRKTNLDLWRDFLNFPYFTGFSAP